MCAVAYGVTGDRSLSEDVAQDTFLAAWRGWRALRDPARLRGWLHGMEIDALPHALVNGQRVHGALPVATCLAAVERAVARSGSRRQERTRARQPPEFL